MSIPEYTKDHVDEIVRRLKRTYPEWAGFEDAIFLADEVTYKRQASDFARENLTEADLASLIESEDWKTLEDRFEKVRHQTNLLWTSVPLKGDLSVLYAAYASNVAEARPRFYNALVDLFFGSDAFDSRFSRYLEVLDELELPSKWTFPTYFLFLLDPTEHLFVKPNATTRFFRIIDPDFRLPTRPDPSLYSVMRQTLRSLGSDLAEFGESDFIHLHSLLWVVGSHEDPLTADRLKTVITLLEEFKSSYPGSEAGNEHAKLYEDARAHAEEWIPQLVARQARGESITDDAIDQLLPHKGTPTNIAAGRWTPVSPMIASDFRKLMEANGWIKSDEWPQFASDLLSLVSLARDQPEELEDVIGKFLEGGYKGVQSGIVSPILSASRPEDFLICNSKPVQVINHFANQGVSTSLKDYPVFVGHARDLLDQLSDHLSLEDHPGLLPGEVFDMFCHWLVAEKNYPFDLGKPFDDVFASFDEAEWALDFLAGVVQDLGYRGPTDERFALTMPKNESGVIRLNMGNWWVASIHGPGSSHPGCIALTLPDGDYESVHTFGAFARQDDPPMKVRVISTSYARANPIEQSDAWSLGASVLKQRFDGWARSNFRHSHQPELFEALFDTEARLDLLRDGLEATVETRFWKIAPGEGAHDWDEQRQLGIIAVGWPALGDLSEVSDDEQFQAILDATVKTHPDYSEGGAGQVWTFRSIRPGDQIVANRGTKAVVGVGTVTGGYFYVEGEPYPHRVPVRWDFDTEAEVNQGGWRSTLIALSEEQFDEIMELMTQETVFGQPTFDLLTSLHETPTGEFYAAHREDFVQLVEQPLQSLMASVVSKLPTPMLDYLETEKRIFSRIRKNDWGRGGAWDWYWGALYPKGEKRISSTQLYVSLNGCGLSYGFAIGDYGTTIKERFNLNLAQAKAQLEPVLLKNLAEGDVWAGVEVDHWDKTIEPTTSTATYFDNDNRSTASIHRLRSVDDVVGLSMEDLAVDIAGLFESLFPFVLVANEDDALRQLAEYLDPDETPDLNPEYTLEQAAIDTGLAAAELRRWVRAIRRKGQAVFYGPPGTGKTFVAKHLAKHLIGGTTGFQDLVQFHPAYSYEDFIEGLRPKARADGGLDYPTVPGRFRLFCKEASKRKGAPCVLIIDEINRANLSRVFGEMMYLLEYRDEEVVLASGTRFKIPENVLVIGTMNTADRSIALVDHALRRRFAFIGLFPNLELLRTQMKENHLNIDGLIGMLAEINEQIKDPNYAVGVSYFLGENIDLHIEDIWKMEIEPYLEEYWFSEPTRTDRFRWENVKALVLNN